MHELGIMTGVVESAKQAANDAGATRLLKVSLSVGEMTEAVETALQFAFEALTEGDPFTEGATLEVNMVRPKSKCHECGAEFEHDRFHLHCPSCGSASTMLLSGRELEIASMDVDLPDEPSATDAEQAN